MHSLCRETSRLRDPHCCTGLRIDRDRQGRAVMIRPCSYHVKLGMEIAKRPPRFLRVSPE